MDKPEPKIETIEVQTFKELCKKLLELCLQYRGKITGMATNAFRECGLRIDINGKPCYNLINRDSTTMFGFFDDLEKRAFLKSLGYGAYSLLPENVILYYETSREEDIKAKTKALKDKTWRVVEIIFAATVGLIATLLVNTYYSPRIASVEARIYKIEQSLDKLSNPPVNSPTVITPTTIPAKKIP